jgi:hypothetical protein
MISMHCELTPVFRTSIQFPENRMKVTNLINSC